MTLFVTTWVYTIKKYKGSEKVYIRSDQSEVQISYDALSPALVYPAAFFRQVSSIRAWPKSGRVLICGVAADAQLISIRHNQPGDLRAYRLSEAGLEQLSDEYSNDAIELPNGVIAYSDGQGLVLKRGSWQQRFRLGPFSWGAPALACNRDASLITLGKWKGDDCKLAYLRKDQQRVEITPHNFFSYLALDDQLVFIQQGRLKQLDLAQNKVTTIGNKTLQSHIFSLLDIDPQTHYECQFSKLSRLAGELICCLEVFDPVSYCRVWQGIIQLPSARAELAKLYDTPKGWRIGQLTSNEESVAIELERLEQMRVVERKTAFLGLLAEHAQSGWRPIASPLTPAISLAFYP